MKRGMREAEEKSTEGKRIPCDKNNTSENSPLFLPVGWAKRKRGLRASKEPLSRVRQASIFHNKISKKIKNK